MRRSLVAGNWKMHGSGVMITGLLQRLVQGLGAAEDGVEVVVCPPAPYLSLSQHLLRHTGVQLGAQNVHAEAAGAYTGEVAAAMLVEFGVRFVIVGHSERRRDAGETDEQVARKCAAALKSGISPIVCVGETLEEREAGNADSVVARQVNAILQRCDDAALLNSVFAYEPVWAIGTGITATPAQAQSMHGLIRSLLRESSIDLAARTRILYGGSVSAENARALFAQSDIDGGLVGGASLRPEEFITICKSVSEQWKP